MNFLGEKCRGERGFVKIAKKNPIIGCSFVHFAQPHPKWQNAQKTVANFVQNANEKNVDNAFRLW